MSRSCPDGQYWDALVRTCMQCRLACQHSPVISRCTSYCESANCTTLPGHYYDGVVGKCMKCADVCDRHPAECSQHCRAPPPSATTTKFLTEKHVLQSRGLSVPMGLETILLYSLLALCAALLFSSLTVALVILLRIARAKPSTPGPKEASAIRKCVVQLGQEVGPRGRGAEDFRTNPGRPTDREPSDDPSPTETCVCIHCFPDLKALGQGSDRPPRAPFSLHPQAVLHGGPTPEGGPLLAGGNRRAYSLEVQAEAAVG